MIYSEENWMIDLIDQIIISLNNDFFNYQDSNIYNKQISTALAKMKENIIVYNINNDNIGHNIEDNTIEYLINSIFYQLFYSVDLNLSDIRSKKLVEDILNQISLKIASKDYTYNSIDYLQNNNFTKSKISPARKILNKMYGIQEDNIIPNSNDTSNSNHIYDFDIINKHNSIYTKIVVKGLDIWKDYKSNNIYYRLTHFDEKLKINKSNLSSYLLKIFYKHIKIYNNIEEAKDKKGDFLIVSLLPIVKKEIYNPQSNIEFLYAGNNIFYKNTFQYTNFLFKRSNLKHDHQFVSKKESYIEKFIKFIVEPKEQYDYIINWITYFFQIMEKTNSALVLIGDSKVTDLFIKNILKPIFAFKDDSYCLINNKTIRELDESKLSSKILFHIDDINSNNKKTSTLVRKLLKRNSISYFDSLDQEKDFIHGQLLITASTNNPYTHLKDSYSHCSVFKVKNLNTILNKFNVDYLTLEELLENDLDNFTSILSQNLFNYTNTQNIICAINTKEKRQLKEGYFNKIIQNEISISNIKDFIFAIKNHKKSIKYFDPIRDYDHELYAELLYNFDENMIARQLLFIYYNIIYNEEIFFKNEDLLELLKQEEEFFNDNINKNKQYKRKKRYKIPQFNRDIDITLLYNPRIKTIIKKQNIIYSIKKDKYIPIKRLNLKTKSRISLLINRTKNNQEDTSNIQQSMEW